MNSKQTLTQRLLDKIEADLGQDNFKIYRSIFTSFIKSEISYATYQEKMVEILGMKLLPFHQRFVSLFRKRVVENKSLYRYKSILIRIKEDKRELRIAQTEMLRKKNSISANSQGMMK
jgi:murein L,D-transpeptidase YafK